MTKEELLINFLLKEDKKGNTEKIYLYREHLPEIGLSENEVIKTATELEEKGHIKIHVKSPHNDLSICMAISLLSPCKSYFCKNDSRNI